MNITTTTAPTCRVFGCANPRHWYPNRGKYGVHCDMHREEDRLAAKARQKNRAEGFHPELNLKARASISNMNRMRLSAWMASRKEELEKSTDCVFAAAASKALGFPVATANVASVRMIIFPDIQRRHPRAPRAPRPVPPQTPAPVPAPSTTPTPPPSAAAPDGYNLVLGMVAAIARLCRRLEVPCPELQPCLPEHLKSTS